MPSSSRIQRQRGGPLKNEGDFPGDRQDYHQSFAPPRRKAPLHRTRIWLEGDNTPVRLLAIHDAVRPRHRVAWLARLLGCSLGWQHESGKRLPSPASPAGRLPSMRGLGAAGRARRGGGESGSCFKRPYGSRVGAGPGSWPGREQPASAEHQQRGAGGHRAAPRPTDSAWALSRTCSGQVESAMSSPTFFENTEGEDTAPSVRLCA